MRLYFNAPTVKVSAPTTRDFVRARQVMAVVVDGVTVYPSRREGLAMLETGVPVPVRQEAVAAAKVDALRLERYRTFCEEDGIVNGERYNPARGVIEVYAPDAMGHPAHVMDRDPHTGEYV